MESIIFKVLNKAFDLNKSDNICIAGGVAQNSVANGKILENTRFKHLYIPSAGHDAGISMGAAQYVYFHKLKNKRTSALYDANLGIEFNNDQIKKILDDQKSQYTFMKDEDLFIADPRNPRAQQLLNEKIKKRESFRPFAPSILEEFGSDYFIDYQFTPFMERVLKIREDKRSLIPAVTHVDGSGRLQSVRKDLRPRYHKLISEFNKLTGIPILINTSFNENEPVVNIPQEAIDTFNRTELDLLVLGNFVLSKGKINFE